MGRYLISDFPSEEHGFENELWHHIFPESRSEEPVRFVFDRETEEVVAAFVRGGTSLKDGEAETWWAELSEDARLDVQDSLRDNLSLAEGSPNIYPDPHFGLVEADEVPEWASTRSPSP